MPPDKFPHVGKVKYPNANYVFCKHIAPERKVLVNYIESIKIPTQVEEALQDPKWRQVMDEEMSGL